MEFWRNDEGKCVPYPSDQDPYPVPENCFPGGTYPVPSGYRRISVSTCVGGLDKSKPVQRPCTSTP